jgi:hypothetical protein
MLKVKSQKLKVQVKSQEIITEIIFNSISPFGKMGIKGNFPPHSSSLPPGERELISYFLSLDGRGLR